MDLDLSLEQRPVLVLDFGAQYVQLIARRIRERKAFARIVRHDLPIERIKALNPLALVLSGGPSSVYEAGAPKCDPRLFDLDVPILGICYGMQLACEAIGGAGSVQPQSAREFGRADCRVQDRENPLFEGVSEVSTVWMSHGDQVQELSDDFIPLAATRTCPPAPWHSHSPWMALRTRSRFGSTSTKCSAPRTPMT